MKLLALFGPACSWRSALFASLAVASLGFGCESTSAENKPAPVATIKEHPPFPMPKTPEMLDDRELVQRKELPLPPPPLEKKDWQANCLIQKKCSPAPREIPACDADVQQRPWADVVAEGDAMLGKQVAVSGTLGMSLIKKTGEGKCAKRECCHKLDMQIVLAGEANGSLPLRGLTCSGDDSTLCCSVPADGQAVVATGKLQKGPVGGSTWQLAGATLCLVDTSPKH